MNIKKIIIALAFAAYSSSQCSQSTIVASKYQLRSMYQAAKKQDHQRLKKYQRYGLLDAHSQKGTPFLTLAAIEDNIPALDALLSAGASTECYNQYGYTPLHEAALSNTKTLLLPLLEHGADVNARTKDKHCKTPLMLASEKDQYQAVALLLAKNADVHATDIKGFTALHAAAYSGHILIINLLLQHKAKVDASTRYGITPCMTAAHYKHPLAVAVLQEAGANLAKETEEYESFGVYDIPSADSDSD